MPTMTTSGTTGKSKTVVRDEAQTAARIARIHLTRGPEFAVLKSMFCGFNRDNASFKQYEHYCTKAGVELLGSTGDWKQTIELINDKKPEGLLSPPSLMLRLARDNTLTHNFRYLRASHVRLEPEAGTEILAKLLAPGGVAYVAYGMSEKAGGFYGSFADAIRIPGCVGKPVDGVEYVIDADHQIRFKVKREHGDSDAYAENKLTDQHFKTIDGALWFYPGDLASLTPDGLLVLEGRV